MLWYHQMPACARTRASQTVCRTADCRPRVTMVGGVPRRCRPGCRPESLGLADEAKERVRAVVDGPISWLLTPWIHGAILKVTSTVALGAAPSASPNAKRDEPAAPGHGSFSALGTLPGCLFVRRHVCESRARRDSSTVTHGRTVTSRAGLTPSNRARVARRRAGCAPADRAAIRMARARDGTEGRTVAAVADDPAAHGSTQGRSASAIGSGPVSRGWIVDHARPRD